MSLHTPSSCRCCCRYAMPPCTIDQHQQTILKLHQINNLVNWSTIISERRVVVATPDCSTFNFIRMSLYSTMSIIRTLAEIQVAFEL
jgi:hypothetical protein